MKLTRYYSREEWVAGARSGSPNFAIGSSTVAAILGRLPWRSPWSVWARAHGFEEFDHGQNDSTRRGRKWEPRILQEYAELLDDDDSHELRTWTCRVEDPDRPWHVVSPDALLVRRIPRPDKVAGVVEAKTSNKPDAWGPDGLVVEDYEQQNGPAVIPVHYALQAFSLMEATRAPWCDFAVMLPDWQQFTVLRVIRLMAHPELQDRILDEVGRWRERHLVGNDEPALDGSQAARQVIAARRPAKPAKHRDATDEEEALVRRYASLKRQLKELEAEAELTQNRILAAAGSTRGLLIPTGDKPAKATVVRTAGRSSVSLSSIRDARPDLADELEACGLVREGRGSIHVRIYGDL